MSSELVPGDAVRAIQAGVQPELIKVRERDYASRPVFLPPPEPVPFVPVVLHTLTALVPFACDLKAKLAQNDALVLHVESPTRVSVLGNVRLDGHRSVYGWAQCDRVPFKFGTYQPQSDFVIDVQVGFEDDDERRRVLSLVGTIKSSRVIEASDDGVTQTVMARKGITREAEVDVKNPFTLRPYRTFSELTLQPSSPFILRLDARDEELPEAGLWACDGDAWKLDAVNSIAEFLVEQMKVMPDTLIIPVFA